MHGCTPEWLDPSTFGGLTLAESNEEDVEAQLQGSSNQVVNPSTKQHPRIGNAEKRLVLQCYNTAVGNGWPAVISSARQEAAECAVLPPHVVDLYLSGRENHIKGRMQRILKACSTQDVPESSSLIRYSTPRIPNKINRDHSVTQKQAVESKLGSEFIPSSGSSSKEERPKEKAKKKKTGEANEAHTRMCEQAINTVGTINKFLSKLDKKLDK